MKLWTMWRLSFIVRFYFELDIAHCWKVGGGGLFSKVGLQAYM